MFSSQMFNCFQRPSMSQAGSGWSSSVRQCVTSEDDLKWRICLRVHPPSTQQIFTVAAQKEKMKMQFRIILTLRVLEDVVCYKTSLSHRLLLQPAVWKKKKLFFFSTKISEKKGEAITQVQGFIALLKFVKKNVKLKTEDSIVNDVGF